MVSGLTGTLVLQDNGGDNLTITSNGSFTFLTKLAPGSTYSVTVLTQPSGETCSVAGGSGTANANVDERQRHLQRHDLHDWRKCVRSIRYRFSAPVQ